jgi:hypothetical protein
MGVFCDAVALMHSVQAPVVHQGKATKQHKQQVDVEMGLSLEAAVITSFEMVLPSALVGNKKDVSGGVFDCLVAYLKSYDVWDPRGHQRGISTRITEGTAMAQS